MSQALSTANSQCPWWTHFSHLWILLEEKLDDIAKIPDTKMVFEIIF